MRLVESTIQAYWDDVKQNALVFARNNKVLQELQIEMGALDADTPLCEAIHQIENPYAKALYEEQYDYLCGQLMGSKTYWPNRKYHELELQLRSDPDFATRKFNELIKATGRTNKKALRKLQNYDVDFVMKRFSTMLSVRDESGKRRVPLLCDMTLSEYKDLCKTLVADTSILYREKPTLVTLFPETLKVDELKKWGVATPDPELTLPTEMYEKRFLEDWVFKAPEKDKDKDNKPDKMIYYNSLALYGFTGDSNWDLESNENRTTIMAHKNWRLVDQVEFKGLSMIQFAQQKDPKRHVSKNDYMEFAEFKRRRNMERISLYEVIRTLLSMQMDMCQDAHKRAIAARESLNSVSNQDKEQRLSRQTAYRTLREVSVKMHLEADESRFLPMTKTYADWAREFGLPISVVEAWKGHQDNKEEERRKSVVLTDRDIPAHANQYELLQTMQTMLRRDLASWDARFKEKTKGHDYDNYMKKYPDADLANRDNVLAAIVRRRNTAAANLGIVQDRLKEVEEGYIMGPIGEVLVSGHTFVTQCLREIIPHAYGELTRVWANDKNMNELEQGVRDAIANAELCTKKLNKLQNVLQDFIHSFYVPSTEYQSTLKDAWERHENRHKEKRAKEVANAFAELPGSVMSKHVANAIAPLGAVHQVATVLERVAVEGGEVTDHDQYKASLQQLKSLNPGPEQDEQLVAHVQSMISEATNDPSSIAKNRFRMSQAALITEHLAETDTVRTVCAEYTDLLKSQQESQEEEHVAQHLPPSVECLSNPESLSLVDSFEEQFKRAAAMVNARIDKESDVSRLESELEEERARIQRIQQEREQEEMRLAEELKRNELIRIEQERIARELIERAEKEKAIVEEAAAAEERRAQEALLKIQQQQIEFNKERIALQSRKDYNSDSLSETSELDVEEPIAWLGETREASVSSGSSFEMVQQDVQEAEKAEEEAGWSSSLSPPQYKSGMVLYYTKDEQELSEATVLATHTDESGEAYYTVSVNGRELQTTAENLSSIDSSETGSQFSDLDLQEFNIDS